MAWNFAAQEALEALHQQHLKTVMGYLDRPIRTIEALRNWADAVAGLQRSLEGDLTVSGRSSGEGASAANHAGELVTQAAPAPQPKPQPAGPRPGQAIPQSCLRMVHDFGPPDDRGWVTCSGCGTVNIVGGKGSGAFDVQTPHAVELP